MTKKYRIIYWTLFTLSILLQLGPAATYVIIGLVQSNLTAQKVTLISTVVIVLIMTIVSLINKVALRSRLWILLIGMYFALDHILTPLMIIAICQTVDELLVTPFKKHYRTKLTISKEIDKRVS